MNEEIFNAVVERLNVHRELPAPDDDPFTSAMMAANAVIDVMGNIPTALTPEQQKLWAKQLRLMRNDVAQWQEFYRVTIHHGETN